MRALPLLLLLVGMLPSPRLAAEWYEEAPVNYSEAEVRTPLTAIRDRIAGGEALLEAGDDRAALRKLLALLDIPVESQVLVFSKTSFQASLVYPQRPRALYYGDNAYVGWIPGGTIEVTTFDPQLGAVFHNVRLAGREQGKKPKIVRDRTCLRCHGAEGGNRVPSLMIRSVHASPSGRVFTRAGAFDTDHSSPLEERWGGWYVTGITGGAGHLGNAIFRENEDGSYAMEKLTAEPTRDLGEVINGESYLGGAFSDIVSLMVLEHQLSVHNALVHGNLTTRRMLALDQAARVAADAPPDAPVGKPFREAIEAEADKILRVLLFADEAELPGNGIKGRKEFVEAFGRTAPRTSDGRSLRDLRLYRRLFKYRCSHLIYSDAFTHLPEPLKASILGKLHGILTQPEDHPDYAYLRERDAIHAILAETLPGWPKGTE